MQNEKTVNRNYCLDFIKGIACICVVFMYCEFPGTLGVLVQCVSRFCVPFFFMVSGYFCFKANGEVDYTKKLLHIGKITLFSSLFYLIITPVYGFSGEITFTKFVYWLVFNTPVYIAGQLWFLFALLYDYILFALLEKSNLRKLSYYAIPLFFALYVFLAQGLHLLGHGIPNMFYRNFLIEGFPFFALGFWIHKYQDNIRIKKSSLIIIVIISTVLCPIERYLLGRDFGVNIATFPQVWALFMLGIKNKDFGKGLFLTKVGTEYSLYVYIIRPAVWHLLDKLYAALHIDGSAIALYMLPVLCLVLTFLISAVYVWLKSLIAGSKKENKPA